ncbi:MAG: DUF3794 domain-containing protein [Halanaerobiales bacterium]|nr:DUF3794 domain-containing protein [Halanaerobiales bacterium]
MAISFDEELIRVEFVIGEDTVTETVTSEITVPDVKPDIERIVDVTADITDIETEIEDGGVNITADIEPAIIYVADLEDPDAPQQPVHFVGGEEVAFQLMNFVDIPEAEPGMNVFTDLTIKRVSYNFDPADPRTVEVTVVITKFVKVTEFRQITVITDVTGIPEEDITEELLRIDDVIGEETITTTISGRIEVPDVKPPIERVLDARADILPVTTEITEDGVIIDGSIEAGVLYVAQAPEGEPQQPVHFVEGTIPLNEALDVPGALPDMTVYTNLTVKRVSFDFISETEVEVDIVIEIFAKVSETRQVTVVTDIISDRVEIERELLRVEDVVGEDTIFETITGRLNVPAGKPDIAEDGVIEASATVLSYDDFTEREGVMIEGTVEGSIIYVADAEDQPVHFAEDTFNFDNFVEIPGTENGMNIHSEVSVQRVSYNQLGPRTVEITVVLRKFVKVTEFKQIDIVTDLVVISPAADEECPPSYVVYVVRSGDTLWKIARRYKTTVDAILDANPDIDPNNLQIGQKICIPEGIMEPKG